MTRPVSRVAAATPYAPPRHPAPIDLRLDANEGPEPDPAWLAAVAARHGASRYPDAAPLEAALAARLGVPPAAVIATAGGDEAIDRICRAFLEPGRALLMHAPSFEMIGKYARLAGADVREVPWERGPFPLADFLARIDAQTAVIAVVTPNNPTGAVATAADLAALSAAAPGAVILADLAYAEFAAEDLTPAVLGLSNAVAVRTFSKAWGLAGLRIGYAAGAPAIIGALRAAGGPYSVSGLSLAAALEALPAGQGAAGVVARREELRAALADLGADAPPSAGNFAYARTPRAAWVRDALAGLGIAVRGFPGRPGMEDALRIAVPPRAADQPRLHRALRAAIAPDAIVLDMDGVIVDVSRSYRRAILRAAETFGVSVSPADVAAEKARGDANNDWIVTQRLLAARGVAASLADVRDRFEAVYQGTAGSPGLRENESLLCDPAFLDALAARVPLAIATGRPRGDAERFLDRFGIGGFFRAVVCMEDGPAKPHPFPVAEAMRRIGAQHAWMVGDTPDDIVAARAAQAVPIGIAAPGDEPAAAAALLGRAGAARVLRTLSELEALLP